MPGYWFPFGRRSGTRRWGRRFGQRFRTRLHLTRKLLFLSTKKQLLPFWETLEIGVFMVPKWGGGLNSPEARCELAAKSPDHRKPLRPGAMPPSFSVVGMALGAVTFCDSRGEHTPPRLRPAPPRFHCTCRPRYPAEGAGFSACASSFSSEPQIYINSLMRVIYFMAEN